MLYASTASGRSSLLLSKFGSLNSEAVHKCLLKKFHHFIPYDIVEKMSTYNLSASFEGTNRVCTIGVPGKEMF